MSRHTTNLSMKRFLKNSLLSAEKMFGLFRKYRERNKSRLLVLCYHSVVSDSSPVNSRTNIAVSQSEFEKQIALLREHWTPVSLAEIESVCFAQKSLPDYSVLVTFDDGFRNNFTLAAPILKKYEVPAIVFLTTGLIGNNELLWPQEVREHTTSVFLKSGVSEALAEKTVEKVIAECKEMFQEDRTVYLEEMRKSMTLDLDEPWQKELYEFMSWDEVRQIREFGVELGGHTVSHPILSSLPPEKLREELRLCKEKIESETGVECYSFAYPNGGKADFNETVSEEVKQAGFRIVFNLYERRNSVVLNPMSIDRLCVTRDVSLLKFEKLLGHLGEEDIWDKNEKGYGLQRKNH